MNQELDDLLKQLGVNPSEWQNTPTGERSEPDTIRKQKEMLAKLAGLIQMQIDQDTATVAELQERVNRLKHGGGV